MFKSIFRFTLAVIATLLVAGILGVLVSQNKQAGLIASGLLAFVLIIAFFKPLPQIKLGNRWLTAALLIFACLPAIAASLAPEVDMVALKERNPQAYYLRLQRVDPTKLETELAALKDQDPDSYLEYLKALDVDRYLAELKSLRPEQHAALVADIQRERQQKLAEEQARQAEIVEQERQQKAKAEAEREAKINVQQEAKSERKSELARKKQAMTNRVVDAIQQHYGQAPQPLAGEQSFCRENGFCTITFEPLQVMIWGAGIAEVQTSTQTSELNYMELCGVVFSGISGANVQFAGEQIGFGFGAAKAAGSYKTEIEGVKIEVVKDFNNLLKCRFFKY